MLEKTAIFIPARMQATRLPGKPLASINGKPMIVHVLERAKETGIKNIYVACAEAEIKEAVEKAGGNAILTKPEHVCGTDRVFEALKKTKQKFEYIINLQGDLPTINPGIINSALDVFSKFKDADIVTLASKITEEADKDNPNIVKAVVSPCTTDIGKALYFTRARAPYGEANPLHHIGIYVYKNSALKKFVKLKPSYLEQTEKLEQLRALENNMKIYVATVATVPIGVDTADDLEKVRKILNENK